MSESTEALKADVKTLARQAYDSGAMAMKLAVVKRLSNRGIDGLVVEIAELPIPPLPENIL